MPKKPDSFIQSAHAMLERNPSRSIRSIAKELNTNHVVLINGFKRLGLNVPKDPRGKDPITSDQKIYVRSKQLERIASLMQKGENLQQASRRILNLGLAVAERAAAFQN